MQVGLTFASERDAIAGRLAGKFRELERVVSSSPFLGDGVREALKAAQDEWLKYSRTECDLVGALTGAGGSWPSTYAVRCQRNLHEQRLQRVQSAIRCVRRAEAGGDPAVQAGCLQQLAPIANRL